jgi:hypothetical protein
MYDIYAPFRAPVVIISVINLLPTVTFAGQTHETVVYGYGSCADLTSERLHCKLQTRPLIREGVLHEEERQQLSNKENYNLVMALRRTGRNKTWSWTGMHPATGGNKYRHLALQVGGVSKIETTKYAHESRGTQIWERLRWRCSAKSENYRPHFSSERAPHINKLATVQNN